MARTINPDEYALKRNQIVEAALRQMMTLGFNNLVIREILEEIHISSGAFHHYFESRDTLLEAIIERMIQQTEVPHLTLVRDPNLTAIQKLQGFFGTLDSLRVEHKEEIVRASRAWYADDNAEARKKMDEAILKHRAPLLNEIVHQGIQEGVFTVAHLEQSGEVILSLLTGMGSAHIRLLSSAMQEHDKDCLDEIVDSIVDVHAAYMDAIERVLGAPANCLYRADAEMARLWVNVMRKAV